MKKIALFTLAVFFGLTCAQAQGDFKAGIHAGLPIGDAGDLSTFALAVELGYLFDVSDEFQAGPTLGYSHSFGDEIDTIPHIALLRHHKNVALYESTLLSYQLIVSGNPSAKPSLGLKPSFIIFDISGQRRMICPSADPSGSI